MESFASTTMMVAFFNPLVPAVQDLGQANNGL